MLKHFFFNYDNGDDRQWPAGLFRRTGTGHQFFLPTSSFHGGISEETRARYRSKALDLLVDRELIYQDALRLGFKPDAKRVDETVEKATKDFGSKKGFQDARAAEGLTLEDYRRRIEKEFVVDVYAKQRS